MQIKMWGWISMYRHICSVLFCFNNICVSQPFMSAEIELFNHCIKLHIHMYHNLLRHILCQWTLKQFPALGYYRQCCDELSCMYLFCTFANISVDTWMQIIRSEALTFKILIAVLKLGFFSLLFQEYSFSCILMNTRCCSVLFLFFSHPFYG